MRQCEGITRTGRRCRIRLNNGSRLCGLHITKLAPTLGPHVQTWIETNLTHGEGAFIGKPFMLDPWEAKTIYQLYEFDPASGRRTIDKLLVELAKGNGKTPFVAAIMLSEFCGPSVPVAYPSKRGRWTAELNPSPSIPIGAGSYEQADNLYGAARLMIEGPDGHGRLLPYLEVFDKEIQIRDRPGKLYRVAAAGGKLDGGLPSALARDELHEWKNTAQLKTFQMLEQNAAKRRFQGGFCLEVDLSTPGDDLDNPESLLGRKHRYAMKVAAGEINDPRFLYFGRAAADPWDLYDPDDLRRGLRQAYPSTFVDIEEIARMWETPADMDEALPEYRYRRYFGGQWVKTAVQWLPTGAWAGQAAPTIRVQDGAEITVGFDGSYNRDSTALYGCRVSDLHVFKIGVWERPPNRKRWQVPRSEVEAAVADTMSRFRVRRFSMDPSKWVQEGEEWGRRWNVVEAVSTSAKFMAPACSKFYSAVVTGSMTHDGDPTLARHVANAVVREVPDGAYIVKDRRDSPRVIDAAVAAVIALDAATLAEAPPRVSVSYL